MNPKFEPYDIVKLVGTNEGPWVVLSKAIEMKSNGGLISSENLYVIQSLDKNHPILHRFQEHSADKLQLLRKGMDI